MTPKQRKNIGYSLENQYTSTEPQVKTLKLERTPDFSLNPS